MSGICGIKFVDKERRVSAEELAPLVQALDPDARGGTLEEAEAEVGLGAHGFTGLFTRVLRLDDPERPTLLAVSGAFTGEDIFRASDADRSKAGLLARRFLDDPAEFLRSLRGSFALAVLDRREDTLYLAVDRFRIMPLFYHFDNTGLVFSSRMASFRHAPSDPGLEIDPSSIVDVIAGSAIHTPKTIYRSVKKLPPGTLLKYSGGRIETETYWDSDYRSPSRDSEAELTAEVKRRFHDAIACCYEADASPGSVGCFLSGGVDSSTLAGVLSQVSEQPVKTFSIGFGDKDFNEIDYARIAAKAFGAEHHEYFVQPADVLELLPTLVQHFDEPFGNASSVPTFYCAKLAKSHGVDYLYAGDAGDELFAGNERYAFNRLFDYYKNIPNPFREYLVGPMAHFAANTVGGDFFTKVSKYVKRASIPYPELLYSYQIFRTIPLTDLFQDDFLAQLGKDYNPYEAVDFHYHGAPALTELDRQLYIDMKLVISDNDLFKVTRMTEAAGVAVRYPFLDSKLVEFSDQVPARIKMRGRRIRSFFKDSFSDLLPPEIIHKTKHGFGLPIPIWLRTDKALNELMHDLVLSPRAVQRGYFSKKGLESVVAHHASDSTSFYGTLLWNLMVLELWHRSYVDGAE